MAKQFYICSCFFSHNIFLHRYTLHCTYHNDEQFKKQYREESRLQPQFLDIVQYCKSSVASYDGLLELISEDVTNVFSFPVLTEEFCHLMLEELGHFEQSDSPKGRPNTMNNHGILVSELGFDSKFVDPLRESYLMPIACLLYPEWVKEGLDSHRAFTVSYTQGGDLDLAYHYDNAEVTINICLGKDFSGGALLFGPMKGEREPLHRWPHEHKVGQGILHRGRHMHEAQPITTGQRHSLIVWMRSSSVRNKQCPMCGSSPSLVESEDYGDGFTAEPGQGAQGSPCTSL